MSRDVNVFLLPQQFEPDDLRGGVAVVLDVLRASTTILTALAQGARCVIPCGDVATARNAAAAIPRGDVLLGGERGGVKIDGFDLDNSPAGYTAERIAGKTIVFTTTNGTAALLRSQKADRVLIGALVNRRAIVEALGQNSRPVHLVCAGTDGRVTSEDLLGAGAIAAELSQADDDISARDDMTMIARQLWVGQSHSRESLVAALCQSRGGRNLVELGFHADIDFAAQVDAFDMVAEYFPKTGSIEAVRSESVPLGFAQKPR